MGDTKWRAVAVGFGVIVLINLLSASVQQPALLGGLVAGLAGGWAAGYYARSGRIDGAWNGFLAGSIGAVAVTVVFLALGIAASIVGLSPGGALAAVGLGVAALVPVVVNAIPAIVGGYVGGMYPRRETEETSRPAA